MQSLPKIFKLSASARRFLVEAAVVCLGVEIAFWIFPFRKLHAWVERLPRLGPTTPGTVPLAEMERLTQALFRRLPFSFTCLKQSLILLILLRRRGIAAELKVGMKKEKGLFQAHAWLEQNRQVIFASDTVKREFPSPIALGGAR